jgi:hypothetical protein
LGAIQGGLKIDFTAALQGSIKQHMNNKIGEIMTRNKTPPKLCYSQPKPSTPPKKELTLEEKINEKLVTALQIKVMEV